MIRSHGIEVAGICDEEKLNQGEKALWEYETFFFCVLLPMDLLKELCIIVYNFLFSYWD